ncbi:MAG: prolipoprotein diacylglyceryl transferase, partial [Pseudomonadota bacterium]
FVTGAGLSPHRRSVTNVQLEDLVGWITLGIIGGGRIGYVLFYEPHLLTAAWEPVLGFLPFPPALALWKGGMSFHGGLMGVTLAGYLYSRRNGLDALRLGDLFACAAPIGLFFGRIANFINGELYGRPTNVPWAVKFPERFNDPLDEWVYAPDVVARHPSQLYEAALEGLVLFGVLAVLAWRTPLLKKPGAAIGVFLAGYGIARSFVENFRQPDVQMPDFPLGLTMGMLLSFPMIGLGGWLAWRAYKGAAQPA